MNDMKFIDLFINNMNIYENNAYFQPITFFPSSGNDVLVIHWMLKLNTEDKT